MMRKVRIVEIGSSNFVSGTYVERSALSKAIAEIKKKYNIETNLETYFVE